MTTLEKIKAEIDEQTEIHSDGEFYIKNIDVKRILAKYAEQEPCEDCDYSEIVDWEQDAKTGKAKPIYWCERHKEPCDDAISREMALKECHDIVVDGERYRVIQEETLLGLPSVRPQEQMGHWEEIVEEHKCYARDDTYTTTEYHCSECGAEPFVNEDGFHEFGNYCPNCGCRMFNQQESEDKE